MGDDVTIKDAADATVNIRTLDNGSGKEIQVFQESLAGVTGRESLVSASNPKPMYFPSTPTFTVSGAVAVTGTFWQATQPVSGTFWQTTQPVSIAAMPSTPVTGTFWQATQPVSAASLPLPAGAATEAGNLATLAAQTAGLLTLADFDGKAGSVTETAPATDTASSGLNGRLQRIAQRLSSLIALLPTALGAGGGIKVDGSGTALPVSGSVTASGTLTVTQGTGTNLHTVIDSGTVAATGTFWQATQPVSLASMPSTPVTGTFWQATQPVSGTVTANAGTNLNTSALALETGGNLATAATALGAPADAAWSGSGNSSLIAALKAIWTRLRGGQAAMASSLPVTIASDQSAVPVSGTFWQGTQPVSAAALPLPAGAAADATLTTIDTDLKSNITLHAGTNVIGKAGIDQTTPGTTNLVEAHTNGRRAAAVVHRNAIAAVDKLATPVIPASVTDVTSGGSLAQGTAHYLAVAAGNQYGNTAAGPIGTVTTAASGGSVHAVKGTIAQVTGATYYDIFMSTSSTAPLWVGRMTETQRANANGVAVTAVGTAGAGSSLGAGVVQVNILGTGLAGNVVPFTVSNAYIPDSVTAVDCTGYSLAHLLMTVAVTDLRSLPTLTLVPFLKSQNDAAFNAGAPITLALLTAAQQSLRQDFWLNTDGSTGLVVALDTITGQGTTVTICVELS